MLRDASRVISLVLFLASAGCSPEPTVGNRTHWLEECDSSQQCGVHFSCLCGVCTDACVDDQDCSGGVCSSLVFTSTQCGESNLGNVCIPPDWADVCGASIAPHYIPVTTPVVDECSPTDALACESFDQSLSTHYKVSVDRASLQTEQCLSVDEQSAIMIRGTTGGFAHLQMALAEEVNAGPLFAKIDAYVPSGQALSRFARLFALRHVDEGDENQFEVRLNEHGGFLLGVESDQQETAPSLIPRDQWVCVELELDVGASGAMNLYLDGEKVFGAQSVRTIPEPGPIAVGVVLGSIGKSKVPFEMVVDDFVVARERIGCD